MLRATSVACLLLACGCAKAPPIDGAPCPCPDPGYTCNKTTKQCEPNWSSCGTLDRTLHARTMLYSPDGMRLAVGFDDGWVRIYRTPDLAVERTEFVWKAASKLAFAPDGSRLAIWRPGFGLEVLAFTTDIPSGGIVGVPVQSDPTLAFSPDGLHILEADAQNVVNVFSYAGSMETSFNRAATAVGWADLSGALVSIADRNFEVRDLTGGIAREGMVETPALGWQLSPDGGSVAGIVEGDTGYTVTLFNLIDGRETWHTDSMARRPTEIRFLQAGLVVVYPDDTGLTVRNLADGSEVAFFALLYSDRDLYGNAWTFSPDGQSFAVVDKAGAIRRLAVADGKDLSPALDQRFDRKGTMLSFAVSRDRKRLSSVTLGDDHESLWIWNIPDHAFLQSIRSQPVTLNSALSSDGTRVMASGDGGLHQLPGGENLGVFPSPPAQDILVDDWVRTFAFSPDGTWIAATGFHGLEIRSAKTLAPVTKMASPAGSAGVAFSPDGAFVATSAPELYQTSDWSLVWRGEPPMVTPPAGTLAVSLPWVMSTAAFSPDGRSLLVSSCAYKVNEPSGRCASTRLLRATDGEILQDFADTLGRGPAFSRDGTWIVAGDQLVHVPSGTSRPLGVSAVVSAFIADDAIAYADPSGAIGLLCPARH